MAIPFNSRGGVPVYADYRQNIIVDPNNPILVWKANKEKFNPRLFSSEVQRLFPQGLPRIGSQHSEDALSWNLFRSLQVARRLSVITRLVATANNLDTIYFWGRDAHWQSQQIDPDIQDILNEMEPWGRDGIRQQTEADVMLRGRHHLIVVECKLGKPGEVVKAWQRTQRGMRPEYQTFIQKQRLKLFADSFDYKRDGNRFYQLFRNYLLAAALASRWSARFSLLAVVNARNSNVEGKSHEEEFSSFRSVLAQPSNTFLVTWQQIWNALLEEINLLPLRDWMETHPLLGLSQAESSGPAIMR